MILTLFLLSIILNVLLYYLYKHWEFNFTQELTENNLFDDKNVNVRIVRSGEILHISVNSKEMSFQANHNLKEDKESLKKKEGKGVYK